MHNFGTLWGWNKCIETCRSDYNINIAKTKNIYILYIVGWNKSYIQDVRYIHKNSCTLSLTLALDGVGGQRHAPAALTPEERAGTYCLWGWVVPRPGLDKCRKPRPRPGFDSRTIQSVASRYTDYAIPAHRIH